MPVPRFDVAVVGSGFGGSLLAMILARRGCSVALIDRGRHPRFAIGESSTPIADLILADLARKYDLPRIAPLSQYGTWRRTYPEIKRGRKRGFSYFFHRTDCEFEPTNEHVNELLVAASSDDERCDTHWYRADVDQFFAEEAVSLGVRLLAETEVMECRFERHWKLSLHDQNRAAQDIQADFLVNATGDGGFGKQWLSTGDQTDQLLTNSRAVYSHFSDVEPWETILKAGEARLEDYPFHCDDAALHHVTADGWMWQLRFDHQVVSAGFSWNAERYAPITNSPTELWSYLLGRYPTIAKQFSRSQIVDPPGKLFLTGRLQRMARRAVGERWASLPHAYGFIDALHSTGIAWNLSGVERLAEILLPRSDTASVDESLQEYEAALQRELRLIDRLVHLCYQSMTDFRLFVPAVMLYFTATVTYEQRRRVGAATTFLCAEHIDLLRRLDEGRSLLMSMIPSVVNDSGISGPSHSDVDACMIDRAWERIRQLIEPYNSAGLCDPAALGMYRHTAAR